MSAMSQKSVTTRDIGRVAMFAALTAAMALFPPITLPFLPVPITTQSMGPMLAGAILGARRGAFSMALVVALVAVGLPILSGGRGGLGVFIGPTGGFLLGWVPAAVVIGALHAWAWDRLNAPISFLFTAVGGIGVLYAIGVPWAAYNAGLPITKALVGAALFIPGDLAKAGLTAVIAVTIRRSFPRIHAIE